MGSYENQILNIMELYYHSKDKALEWYKRPHNLLSDWKHKESPEDMVKAGKGKQVLDFIKMVLDK
jgi:predicted metal-binding protein